LAAPPVTRHLHRPADDKRLTQAVVALVLPVSAEEIGLAIVDVMDSRTLEAARPSLDQPGRIVI